MHINQFVPSATCLKCDGCCNFQSPDSAWRPKWNKREFVDDHDYVTTVVDCGKHVCRFFNTKDHTCRTYHDRPFECALYPFLISKHFDGVRVYVHLACPYVQDHQASTELTQYIDYLKNLFTSPQSIDYLKRNRALVHDYTPFENEMIHLFAIPGLIL